MSSDISTVKQEIWTCMTMLQFWQISRNLEIFFLHTNLADLLLFERKYHSLLTDLRNAIMQFKAWNYCMYHCLHEFQVMCSVGDLEVKAIICVYGRIPKFRLDARMRSTEQELSTSMEFFIVIALLLIEINNTATRGSTTSRIPYGDK